MLAKSLTWPTDEDPVEVGGKGALYVVVSRQMEDLFYLCKNQSFLSRDVGSFVNLC